MPKQGARPPVVPSGRSPRVPLRQLPLHHPYDTVRHAAGVGVHDGHVLQPDAERARHELRPRGLVPLAVRRGAGGDGDPAVGLDPAPAGLAPSAGALDVVPDAEAGGLLQPGGRDSRPRAPHPLQDPEPDHELSTSPVPRLRECVAPHGGQRNTVSARLPCPRVS